MVCIRRGASPPKPVAPSAGLKRNNGEHRKYKWHILTIATDNDSDFMCHRWLALRLDSVVYFADPFCSGQKGAVENANELLRQYFPKGTDFRMVEQAGLDCVQAKINCRHREKLNFSSPKVEFFKAV